MTYDKIAKIRISRTCQYSIYAVKKRDLQRGYHSCTFGQVWGLKTSSIQVHSRSSENKPQAAYSGTKGGIYSQAAHKPDISRKRARKINRTIIEQYYYTSVKCISQKKEAWLINVHRDKFRCFIVLTAWEIINFPRPIDFWFQKK